MQGKVNCVLDVTLAANAGSTTVTDARLGYFTAILYDPMTANAGRRYCHDLLHAGEPREGLGGDQPRQQRAGR